MSLAWVSVISKKTNLPEVPSHGTIVDSVQGALQIYFIHANFQNVLVWKTEVHFLDFCLASPGCICLCEPLSCQPFKGSSLHNRRRALCGRNGLAWREAKRVERGRAGASEQRCPERSCSAASLQGLGQVGSGQQGELIERHISQNYIIPDLMSVWQSLTFALPSVICVQMTVTVSKSPPHSLRAPRRSIPSTWSAPPLPFKQGRQCEKLCFVPRRMWFSRKVRWWEETLPHRATLQSGGGRTEINDVNKRRSLMNLKATFPGIKAQRTKITISMPGVGHATKLALIWPNGQTVKDVTKERIKERRPTHRAPGEGERLLVCAADGVSPPPLLWWWLFRERRRASVN